MSQLMLPIADAGTGTDYFPTVNPIDAVNPAFWTQFFVKDGASEYWECINALGDTAFLNTSLVGDGTLGDQTGWQYGAQLDAGVDPGVDTDHKLIVRMRWHSIEVPADFQFGVTFNAPSTNFSAGFQKFWSDNKIGGSSAPAGDFAAAWNASGFTTIELPLTELEVQTFRSAGGYAESYVIPFTNCYSSDGSAIQCDCDISYIALETPGSGGGPDLELTQTGGYEISGSGADYLVQSGGYEVSGGGEPFINEIEQTGGYEVSGGGDYGSNEIVQSGGVYFTGGGSDFYLIAPSIGGIYVLVPDKRDDTWYKRDGLPLETVDVKIPDPFVSLAYLPKDT